MISTRTRSKHGRSKAGSPPSTIRDANWSSNNIDVGASQMDLPTHLDEVLVVDAAVARATALAVSAATLHVSVGGGACGLEPAGTTGKISEGRSSTLRCLR
eukprot:COSAG01_NODE_38_length_33931_cov_75.163632_30_plen_101_part_00